MLNKSFIPTTRKVEIEITTLCNLKCINCDRSCRQAPSNEAMTVKQIMKFVNDSIRLEWNWTYIGIIGGEPTLHTEIFKLIAVLKKYLDFNSDCKLEIITNGFGKKVNDVLNNLPDYVNIRNSQKTGSINKFSSYNEAPIDLKKFEKVNFKSGCWITEYCALGLTRYGFYPCGAGASVDRIFGFDIGIKNLSSVSIEKLQKQLKILCAYCGHFKDFDLYMPNGKKDWILEEKISKSWIKAYSNYKKVKPSLTLY